MNERDKELADKARFVSTATPPTQDEILQKFADLIRADEREACAKVCEEIDDRCPQCAGHDEHEQCFVPEKWRYVEAIRARSQA